MGRRCKLQPGQGGPHSGTSRDALLPCSTPRPPWAGSLRGPYRAVAVLQPRRASPRSWHKAPRRAPAAGDSAGTATATPAPCRSPPDPALATPLTCWRGRGGPGCPRLRPGGPGWPAPCVPGFIGTAGSRAAAAARPLPPGLGIAPLPGPAPSPHKPCPRQQGVCVPPLPSRDRRGGGCIALSPGTAHIPLNEASLAGSSCLQPRTLRRAALPSLRDSSCPCCPWLLPTLEPGRGQRPLVVPHVLSRSHAPSPANVFLPHCHHP